MAPTWKAQLGTERVEDAHQQGGRLVSLALSSTSASLATKVLRTIDRYNLRPALLRDLDRRTSDTAGRSKHRYGLSLGEPGILHQATPMRSQTSPPPVHTNRLRCFRIALSSIVEVPNMPQPLAE